MKQQDRRMAVISPLHTRRICSYYGLNNYIFFRTMVVSLSLFISSSIKAQETITQHEGRVKYHYVTYNYFGDDLGYFEKLHGWQTDVYSLADYGSTFKIKYDNGIPKCFTVNATLPLKGRTRYNARGFYDRDGICSFYVDVDGNGLTRHFIATKEETETGNRYLFDSSYQEITGARSCIEEVSGFFDKNSYFIFQRCEGPSMVNKRNVKNFVLIGTTMFDFAYLNTLDEFVQLDCRSIDDMVNSGYEIIDYTDIFSDYLKKGLVANPAYLLGAFAYFHGDDLVEGFEKTSSEYGTIPSYCWNTKFGPSSLLNVFGIKDIDNLGLQSLTTYYEIAKVVSHDTKTINYLSEEQYEKYKNLLEYDATVRKHAVKKADGSLLYVPDKYEEQIVKTPGDLEKDKAEDRKLEVKRNNAEVLFYILQAIRKLQDKRMDFPDIDEAFMNPEYQ